MKAIELHFPVVCGEGQGGWGGDGCFCLRRKVVLIVQRVDIILKVLKLMKAYKPYILGVTFSKKESFGGRT